MRSRTMSEPKPTVEVFKETVRRRIRAAVLIGALVVGLLGGGGMLGYYAYTKLALTLQGLQRASTAEQLESTRLARKADDLAKVMEQAQTRVKSLEAGLKTSEERRGRLEARNTQLETAIQGLQAATAAEQAMAGRLTQKDQELSNALAQAEARVKSLEAAQRAAEQAKSELEAKSTKLETAVQGLQATSEAEQATTKQLAQKAEELAKALEDVQSRPKSRERKAREGKPVEEKPGDLASLNYAVGLGYSERGMNEEALKAFKTALWFDRNHAESHLQIARLYLGPLENKGTGLKHLREYLALRPTAENADRVKGWVLRLEKELQIDKDHRSWGKMDVNRGLPRIFD
jgi:tetratricopeptide (TPR) repeat protein